jgi:hypothetical protein
MSEHACPKSVSSTSGGKGIFPVAAYFGPEAGKRKGRNLAASAAMDGEASEATGNVPFPERIVPHDQPENRKRRAPLEPFE